MFIPFRLLKLARKGVRKKLQGKELGNKYLQIGINDLQLFLIVLGTSVG